ncbi:Sideroflexin-3 [Microtus ochrogaster]|uniref:Sideroflexin-3 n=1 Tax=Microtus ochrogaster TaxID=79684 RepID=A0A8J6KN05_MICOH|nr:Sideroflexin-3 [Microtus ochrogaster]
MGDLPLDINIQEPRWDQSTFLGRARHFFTVTDPRNLLLSGDQLEASRNIVQNYRAGVATPGLTEDQLWRAKYVYDSAFHPDTGEKVVLIGRMSAQVPMNMTITGCMLTFYRKTPTVVFWQWVNQSFNAIVNYSNRSGDAPITVRQLGTAYVSATTGAVATALGLKSLTKHLPPLVGRFVPFAAVAAANCINIPLMRQRELQVGIPVTDEAGQRLGHSVTAAKQGIFQVVISRIGMAIPAMAIPPVIMNALEKKDFLKRRPWLGAPLQVGLVGFCLVFATPLCCALFPQRRADWASSPTSQLGREKPSTKINSCAAPGQGDEPRIWGAAAHCERAKPARAGLTTWPQSPPPPQPLASPRLTARSATVALVAVSRLNASGPAILKFATCNPDPERRPKGSRQSAFLRQLASSDL